MLRDKMKELEAYYQTDWWKQKRKEVLRARPFCQVNHDHAGPYHVHHATYARLGRELDTDLLVLCSNCHMKVVHQHKDEDDLLWGAPE